MRRKKDTSREEKSYKGPLSYTLGETMIKANVCYVNSMYLSNVHFILASKMSFGITKSFTK